jgi:hypothetical protein
LGSLTEITSIRTTATPEFTPDFGQAPAKELLEFVGKKIAFNCLLDHALLLDSRARKEPACKRFEIDYAFELDSCKVVVSSEDVTGTLTYVGSRFVLLEADGILMQLMQGDFADLTNFASGKSYFLPWYNWISSRVLHNFMESEVHQNLVTFAGGHSVQELHEHLGRTLTPEYIESAILSLIRILRIRLWWSRAHLFLMVLFCGIPAVCAFALLKEPMHRTMTAGAERIFIQPMETFALIASIIGPVIFSGITLTFIFRHIHAFRVKRCGGIPLVDFASIARIRFGRTSGYIAMSLALVLSVYFFHRYPRWIDTSGKLYGIVQFTNPPEILEVKVPKFAKKTKTKVNK